MTTNKIFFFKIMTILCVFLFANDVVFAAPVDDFVITVNTHNPGSTSDTQFKISTYSSELYNYNVDCNNDGIDEATGLTGSYICNYSTAGIYTIRIKDNTGIGTGFPRINYYSLHGDINDGRKIESINQWGTGHWTSMEYAFSSCSYLNSRPGVNNGGGAVPDWATDAPDLSHVRFMTGMFSNANLFNQDISNWDVSNVRNMKAMFSGAESFNQDISRWNVSNVRDMTYMFFRAKSFNQNLGDWDVSNVDNMTNMFTYSGMTTENYDNTLIGWSTLSLQNNIRLDSPANYCLSESQRQYIIDTFHWKINDAGKSCVSQYMNVPSEQHTYFYLPVKHPVLNINPASAKPFAVGDLQSGLLSLKVGLKAFTNPVDIYLAISYSGYPDDIFLIDSSNGLQKNLIVPWKKNQKTAINESLFGRIKKNNLPEGIYTLYTLVVPANATNLDNSYLWTTSFNIMH